MTEKRGADPLPADPSATARCRRLYDLLRGCEGKKILTAQQESPGRSWHDQEMAFLKEVTGCLPAIRGLDFIHNDFDGCVERALRWNDAGGIVTICWHTGVDGAGYPDSKEEHPSVSGLLKAGSPENGRLMKRWEEAAKALDRLRRADVPVLWRPFHEFDGRWFWWGKDGGESFAALWKEMRRVFVKEHGLNNLLWVLGYADDVEDGWYPGDGECDLLGSDTYRGETTHKAACDRLGEICGDKPRCFHECGKLPPAERFFEDGAPWVYVMPWHGRWLTEENTPERIRAFYRSDRTLCLDETPPF